MLMKFTTKHESNCLVTFVTHKRFAVLFFLPSCCVNSLITSEQRLQKFHTDDVRLLRSGLCFGLVVTFVTHKRFAVLFFLPSCCVNSLITSEQRLQKFHTDNVRLLRSGLCFGSVVPREKFVSSSWSHHPYLESDVSLVGRERSFRKETTG